MVFGICGCDRCFMGQFCLGFIKWLTGGGFLIWHLIDYWVAVISALTKAEDINMMGYHAEFDKDTLEEAFIAAIVLLIWQSIGFVKGVVQRGLRSAKRKAKSSTKW